MKISTQIQRFALSAFSCMALMAATVISNRMCVFIFHQPKQPKGMDKFRRHM